MQSVDLCKYVDVFLGNGETDRFFEDGLASKWFYIKALCGNTTPHVTRPFGKMSVGAYSGGYPTGYGMHFPNYSGGIEKFGGAPKIKGFSHLHQSGTGSMGYYYNYAVTSPFYTDINEAGKLRCYTQEEAKPGYYKVMLEDILCELTVDGEVAVHRYTFGHNGGRVAVDFSNNGLSRMFDPRFASEVSEQEIRIVGKNEVVFSGIFSGIRLYFCVRAEADLSRATIFSRGHELNDVTEMEDMSAPYGAIFDFEGNSVLLRVGYSTSSFERAQEIVDASVISFETAAGNTYEAWNKYLAAISIQTDDEQFKKKFYSNLYHSLIKPCDMFGENIMGVQGSVVSDLATLWDQYKTALPLIYLCYPDMSEKIVKGIVNISRTLGKIPCSFGLANIFPCEEQAKALGILTLCDAYHMNVKGVTVDVIEECMQRELARDDYASFLETGYFERYTHILDVTDACLDVAQISQNSELKERLLALAQHWRNAYGGDALLSQDSPYYEGDRYTYSFRLQKNMDERVSLAGGKEAFAALLDSFFGFNGESVQQCNYIGAGEEIKKRQHHRFQGFNNECDMETPYAYIYAGRHDRLCEILHECATRSFGLGTGGLPGNNDSGGLSSLLVWNVLGLFPVSGSGEFLVGAPQVDGAEITLANGRVLHICVDRKEDRMIYVDRVEWNGSPLDRFGISMQELMCGGTLHFFMKNK